MTRATCSYAKDGICKLPQCTGCKLTQDDSDFHETLCIGSYTWADVQRMQKRNKPETK